MKHLFKGLAVAACVLCLGAGTALAACGEKPGGVTPSVGENVWYLSSSSEFFPTYEQKEDVPASSLFAETSEDVFTLTIQLSKGEEFTVNQIGSDEKTGYSALFSAEEKLVRGTDGAFAVAESGTFALSLDVSSSPTLTYAFTPEQTELPPEKSVVSVSFTRSLQTMTAGQSTYFIVSVLWSDESKTSDAEWSSSDQTVLSVGQDGRVTALSAGSSTVTATAGERSASVTVTVQEETTRPTEIPVTGISFDKTDLLLERDGSYRLSVTFEPENATDKSLIWESLNENVVTVDQEGLVQAVAPGSATVTCMSVSGGRTTSCSVVVRQPVSSVSVQSTLTLVAGGNPKPLSVNVLPVNATDKSVNVTTVSGAEFVSIEKRDGSYFVSGIKQGAATIQVVSADNENAVATCRVTVYASGTVVADLDARTLTVPLGGQGILTPIVDGATVNSVTWSSENDEIVSVESGEDNTGVLTGVKFGVTNVTARISTSAGERTASCKVYTGSQYFYISGSGSVAGVQTSWDSGLSMDDASNAKRLLDETAPGIFTLTRQFLAEDAFQIIFPEIDTEWTTSINPLNGYFDAENSHPGLTLTSDSKNVIIGETGIYTVTLNLNKENVSYTVVLNGLSVTGVSLSVADKNASTLITGNTETTVLLLTVDPVDASYNKDEIEWWVETPYEDWLLLTPSADRMSCNISLADVTSSNAAAVRVHCAVSGHETYFSIAVVPKGAKKNPVLYLIAEQLEINIDVADSWTGHVFAHVNEDATVQTVSYKPVEKTALTVDELSGEVTAHALGVYHVRASSTDAPNMFTTITVNVYSSSFFLAGILQGNDLWQADNFASYGFEQVVEDGKLSYTKFRLENAILFQNDQYKIVYGGIDEAWNKVINYKNLDKTHADNMSGGTDNGILVTRKGTYTITLDLSGETPSFTVTRTGDGNAENTDDFSLTLYLYGEEDLWQGADKPLASWTGTLSPKSGNMTATLECTFSAGVWPTIKFAVQKEGASAPTYYEGSTITYSGSGYTSSKSGMGWCNNGTGDKLYRVGSQALGTYTFTVTFNGDGIITKVTIS